MTQRRKYILPEHRQSTPHQASPKPEASVGQDPARTQQLIYDQRMQLVVLIKQVNYVGWKTQNWDRTTHCHIVYFLELRDIGTPFVHPQIQPALDRKMC